MSGTAGEIGSSVLLWFTWDCGAIAGPENYRGRQLAGVREPIQG